MGPIMLCIKVTVPKHFKLIKEDGVTWVEFREEFPFIHVQGVVGVNFNRDSSSKLERIIFVGAQWTSHARYMLLICSQCATIFSSVPPMSSRNLKKGQYNISSLYQNST